MRTNYSTFVLAVLTALGTSVQAQEKDIQKDEQDLEILVITASPLQRTVLESSTPVTIISGEELDQNQAATLGETLRNVPGVHGSYFGPVASSPIIRGLDGPRIKVVQNGLDASDASRVGPDHQVATETSTATQIEVLRGPATLLYGSGAIGGVVNVVDDRLPISRKEGVIGEVFAQYDDVANAKTFSTNLNGGIGNFAWHLDAYDRNSEDYKIPVPADIDGEGGSGKLSNTGIAANGFTLGAGWINDDTRAALSYGRMDSKYGIPGEDGVFIKLVQNRYQGVVDWNNLEGFFKSVHWQNAYTHYQHSEFEGEEIGTTFKNETVESRLWAEHSVISGWKGVVGLHYNQLDFSAIGEEAFTPPTKTDSLAVFLMEERKIGPLLWQLGARAENLTHKVDNDFFAELALQDSIFFENQDFTAVSTSAGVVWSLSGSSSVSFNYAFSQRAPSASEVFSFGPHIGSGTYEIGGGLAIIEEDGQFSVIQAPDDMKKEVSNNLDLTYRYTADTWNTTFSFFHNQVGNYVFEQVTDLVASDGELITQQAFDDSGAEEGLPVIIFSQEDAKLYGFEAQLDWHLNEEWRWEIFSDFTRAELDSGGNVPRIPPMRIGSSLHFEVGNWHAEVEVISNSEQNKIAAQETETDGYTLLSASANYYFDFDNVDMTIYLKGDNLTNQEARVHSSYIKDEAPLPGRSISLGLRAKF